jgi:hypothetical protein
MGANIRLETPYLDRHHGNLECICFCRHRGIVDGRKLARWFFLHMWDSRLMAVRDHLRCSKCGKRPEFVRATGRKPNAPDRFPKDEAAWKRLVKRLRD